MLLAYLFNHRAPDKQETHYLTEDTFVSKLGPTCSKYPPYQFHCRWKGYR